MAFSNNDRNLVVKNDPKSPAAEAYRTLRTNLQFTSLDKPLRSIMITSSGPQEGKTTVSSNLAVSLAQTDKKVVIVGVDLRRPTLFKQMNISNSVGLTNVLAGSVSLDEALVESDISNLYIIPAGPIPPNPAELLGSNKMKDILLSLTDKFDTVLLDAPPIIAVADAVILAKEVDGVLLVVSVGETPREIAVAAKEQLEKANARILGVVANNIREESGYYYYYYKQYYAMDGSNKNRKNWWHKLFWRQKNRQRRDKETISPD